MAVADRKNSQLRLVFYDGEDSYGEPIYKVKSFNNIKADATTDQLFTVATAIVSLQERPLYNIERKDSSEIRAE